jgi:hypothetical protein
MRLIFLAKSGSGGTRADQGVRPTIYAGFQVSGKVCALRGAQNVGAGRTVGVLWLIEAVNRLGSLFYGSLLGVSTLAFYFPKDFVPLVQRDRMRDGDRDGIAVRRATVKGPNS